MGEDAVRMGEDRTGRDQPDWSADKLATGRRRVSVNEAADVLGLTVEAIRGRIRRNTIDYERINERVYVLVPPALTTTNRDKPDGQPDDQLHDQRPDEAAPMRELVEELRGQVDDLRRRLDQSEEARRRADTIIMQLSARVPEIEAGPEPRGSRESVAQDEPGTNTPPEQASPETATQSGPRPRSWWRRLIGG